VVLALCDDDDMRPPDFFEVKRRETVKIKDPIAKKMAKKARGGCTLCLIPAPCFPHTHFSRELN
jgi:hypothetical protein